jgi:hypothetical protein
LPATNVLIGDIHRISTLGVVESISALGVIVSVIDLAAQSKKTYSRGRVAAIPDLAKFNDDIAASAMASTPTAHNASLC